MSPYTDPFTKPEGLHELERRLLTLDELEALCWEFRDQGASIIAWGDGTWRLQVRDAKGVQRTFRAERVESGGAA